MSSEWINYKGRTILYLNFAGLKGEELSNEVKEGCAKMLGTGGNVSVLVNLDQTVITPDVMAAAKDVTFKIIKPNLKKMGYFGVTGIKAVFVNSVGAIAGGGKMRIFNTEAEAKEWIINEE